jgi:hypothetical protein
MMPLRRSTIPPVIDINSLVFLNLAFHRDESTAPPDPRTAMAAHLNLPADSLVLLSRLTKAEAKILYRLCLDADTEAWALIVGAAFRGSDRGEQRGV